MNPPPSAPSSPPSLLAARLQPPRGTARLATREALMSRLMDARRQRCVVLNGPAGAGKTTLMAAWRRALMPLGFEAAWLSVAPQDDEPERFLDAVTAAVAQVDAAMAAEASLLGGSAVDGEGIERQLVALVRGIAAQGRELLLVLDDLHHLADARIHAALQWLLDFAPPNLHLALVSRAPLLLSFARLRAQRQVLELGMQDLRFSLAEAEQFLRLLLGEGVDARSVRRWHQLTDGWVAGLQLLALQWRRDASRHQPAAAPEGSPLRDARAFSRFFEREVFARLDAQDMRMLVAMAVCERFCGALCATLAGQPEQAPEAAARLARLETENLFIASLHEPDGPDTWYRLHPLLRETLLLRFAAADPARRQAVHARAWRWFRDRDLLEEAVVHALQAGEQDEAAELIERCAQALFLRGERGKFVALLRQLPAAGRDARLGLRLWSMRAHFFLREKEACERSIAQLRAQLPPGDAASRFLVDVHAASLAVQCDSSDMALDLLPSLEQPPAQADPVVLGGSRNIRSWLHMHRGEYEAAREVQAQPPIRVDGQALVCTAAGSLYGRCLAGLSYALEGRMREAERILRASLHEAEALGKPCADTAFFAAALLAEALVELDEPQEARALLEPRVEVLERMAPPDAVLRALRAMSAVHWLAGHRMEALAWLERLEDHATQHGLPRLLAHSLAWQAMRRIELGETLAAQACVDRLDALHASSAQADAGVLREIGGLAQRVRARWCAVQGDLDGAASRLRGLIAQCEARRRMRAVARLQLEAAVVDARRGLAGAAHAQALDALRLGHRLGLLRSLLDVDRAMPLVRALAGDAQSPLDPVLAFYVERLDAAARRGEDAGAQAARAHAARRPRTNLLETFSGREIDMLRLLNQAMPNKKIARTLGLSPETVKWYLSRIYAKLRVAGRDEAVARVRDLGWEGELASHPAPAPAPA